jgi:TonB family protein
VEGIFTLRNLRSMGAAAIVEILLASGVAAILIWQQLHRETQIPPPMAGPIVEFPQQPPPLPRTVPVPQRSPQTPPLQEVQPVQSQVPTPTTEPVQAPPPPLLPAQQPQGMVSEFAARMLQAINDQKVYPKLQLIKGVTGEAVISFDYVDGVVSNIQVDRSSGSHELDEAAIQAVQRAALPTKPMELAGLNHFVFTLAFNLGE